MNIWKFRFLLENLKFQKLKVLKSFWVFRMLDNYSSYVQKSKKSKDGLKSWLQLKLDRDDFNKLERN